jgi:DNA polymerase
MTALSIDFETRSTVDLKSTGVYPYAAHPDTAVWCMAWAFDDEDPQIWVPDADRGLYGTMPNRILDHIMAGGEIRAWNAQFERTIWREIMHKRYSACEVLPEQWFDTAADAAAMALPRSLDQAAAVLGVSETKDSVGHALMLRMARPRSRDPLVWWDDPDKLARLYAYCKQDVRTEIAVGKAVRKLNPKEREIYLLDQRINDRGIKIDRPLVLAAMDVADEGAKRADAALDLLTGGHVSAVMNHKDLTAWINTQGVPTLGVSKPVLKELMEGKLPPAVREALQLRSDAGRTSVAKLHSMLAVAGADDRARGLLLYHGAGTGRWSGKLIQPHNFPRGEVSNVEQFIEDILDHNYDMVNCFHHPTIVVSSLLRSMIVADEGKDLIAGDYSAIEARVLNWLAGQEDTLAMFRAYDSGNKDMDPYKAMAVRMGRAKTVQDVTYNDRQAGKAAELGCGYGMGAAKFVEAAYKVYQVRVDPAEAKAAVDAYRQFHPRVKQLWYDVENACLDAIRTPGVVQSINTHLRAVVAGAYLYIVLPSGRTLAYAAPRIEPRQTPWGATKDSVTFMGVAPFGPKAWVRLSAYGGLLVENVVQAVARDLLAEGMLRLEAAAYPPVLSVHDEVVSEIPQGFGSQEEFNTLLATAPAWGVGCPVAVEGWRGPRYRK